MTCHTLPLYKQQTFQFKKHLISKESFSVTNFTFHFKGKLTLGETDRSKINISKRSLKFYNTTHSTQPQVNTIFGAQEMFLID